MKNLSLLVMAAGMGSRYGGLKQLDQLGPNGETIIDYSVYDAIKAGFTKVVFIIRKDFEDQFKSQITEKYSEKIDVAFAFQNLDDLPDNFICPDGREKPWGSGMATISLSSFRANPSIADPSNVMPLSSAPSNSAIVIAKPFSEPKMSVNHSRMNFTSFSLAICIT